MANKDSINFNVLDSISVIANKLADSRLRIRRTQEFSKAQERLDSYFKTTSDATWMLCGIISYYFDNNGHACNFNELSDFFCVPVMKVLSYKSDIESLLKKGYITNTMGLDSNEVGLQNSFELSRDLLHCIISNKKITITDKNEGEDFVFSTIRKMGALIESPLMSFEKISEIMTMEKKLVHNSFFAETIKLVPDVHDRMFFYNCCSDLFTGFESRLSSTIESAYGDSSKKFKVADEFMNESHVLLKKRLD